MRPEEFLATKYKLIHRLGAGGGGLVFKGTQVSTGQTVAIKVLPLAALGEDARQRRLERFRREIAFCSQLYHPDIVRLLDSGDTPDGSQFAVFEFLPGNTLAHLIAEEGALKVDRALSLMSQLLPPLAYAHEKGIFHRDLKPGNIMVTRDGARDRLKILDFGISIGSHWDDDNTDRLTLTHEWVGTPAYAAPEQLRGEDVGPGVDLYAWGLMFLECLTGSPVVTGKSLPEIFEQQLRSQAHVLPEVLRDHRLGKLLARVLDKSPVRRSSDADSVLSLLETLSISDVQDGHGYLADVAHDVRLSSAIVSDTVTDQPRGRTLIEPRRATVLCCHLVPSGNLDSVAPERVDASIDDGNMIVREILNQYGATVAEPSGPFTLAYFGLSRAQDSDARLALEASLDVADRIDQASRAATEAVVLRAKIGIHNGPVMVQLREGSRRRLEGLSATVAMQLALLGAGGDDPSGAKETEPTPGSASDDDDFHHDSQIVVSGDFQAVMARQMNLGEEELTFSLPLPWRRDPLPAYRVMRGSVRTGQVNEGSAFYGRVEELQALREAWERRTSAERTAAIVIEAEPGVGKSRLVLEFGRLLAESGAQWIEARCLPEWRNGSLRPLAGLCLRALGLDGLPAATAGARLEPALVALGITQREAVPLLCAWLSVPLPDGHAPLAWSPQKQRSRLHQTVADLVIGRLEKGAALLIEDLHWADPSTVECIDVLLKRAAGRDTFVVMTTRPTTGLAFAVPVMNLKLGGLEAHDARRLAQALLPAGTAADADAMRIAARSDGIPLYLEELAMAFRAQVNGGKARPVARRPDLVSPEAVPPSLHDLLCGRLDDVGDAKRTAQMAATVGREFSRDMLATLLDQDPIALLGDLKQLVGAGLLSPSGAMSSDSYSFRHSLIRDAAYDSMSEESRRRTHLKVAEGMTTHFPALAQAQPDVVAHHWEGAGQAAQALEWWQLAAVKSNMASAHLEALEQLDRALALVPQLPQALQSPHEAALLVLRGATLIAKRGYTDPMAATSFEHATGLVPAAGNTPDLAFGVRWGLWHMRVTEANLQRADQLTRELGEIARASGDAALLASAAEAECQTSFCRSEFEASVRACAACDSHYDFEKHRHLCTVRGDDPLLASLSFAALAELLLAQWGRALATAQRGLDLAGRLGFPGMTAAMHSQVAWLRLVWGGSGASVPDVTLARVHANLTLTAGDELGFPFWAAYGRALDAAGRMMTGDQTALEQLRVGIEARRAVGATLGRCFLLTFLGQGLRRAGQYKEARFVLDEALQFCEDHDSRYFQPEVLRERAELQMDPSNPRRDRAGAVDDCRRALDIAASIGSKWWALATRLTLARFGARGDIQALERMISDIPPQPHEPPILIEARALTRF